MKKKILLVAIAVCLVAVVAAGSLAYFTDSKTVTNKFMVAKSSDDDPPEDADDIFSITVTEPNGPANNVYTKAVPGKIFDKDPTITNTGDFDQWVRVTLTISQGDKWLAADDSLNTPTKVFNSLIANVEGSDYTAANWVTVFPTEVDEDNNLVYTFYYASKLTPGNPVTLFKKVQIPTCLDEDDMYALRNFEIIVTADAIQADNTLATAKATFESSEYWTED